MILGSSSTTRIVCIGGHGSRTGGRSRPSVSVQEAPRPLSGSWRLTLAGDTGSRTAGWRGLSRAVGIAMPLVEHRLTRVVVVARLEAARPIAVAAVAVIAMMKAT